MQINAGIFNKYFTILLISNICLRITPYHNNLVRCLCSSKERHTKNKCFFNGRTTKVCVPHPPKPQWFIFLGGFLPSIFSFDKKSVFFLVFFLVAQGGYNKQIKKKIVCVSPKKQKKLKSRRVKRKFNLSKNKGFVFRLIS